MAGNCDPEGLCNDLAMWTVAALKDHLRERCRPVSGNKNVLIMRVFNCIEENIQPLREGVSEIRALKSQYQELLKRLNIQDPLELTTGWINEDNGGSAKWPNFTSVQLMKWAAAHTGAGEMTKYKIDKAYQYFQSELTQNVSYHSISQSSPVCLLLNLCVRSMEQSKEPHEAWVCLRKTVGEVQGGYCSCVILFLREYSM